MSQPTRRRSVSPCSCRQEALKSCIVLVLSTQRGHGITINAFLQANMIAAPADGPGKIRRGSPDLVPRRRWRSVLVPGLRDLLARRFAEFRPVLHWLLTAYCELASEVFCRIAGSSEYSFEGQGVQVHCLRLSHAYVYLSNHWADSLAVFLLGRLIPSTKYSIIPEAHE